MTEYNIKINEIEKHLLSLYDKAKELTLRARRNNSNRQQILIPFSDNQHPFTIKYDVNLHIPEHTRSLSGSLLGYKTIP